MSERIHRKISIPNEKLQKLNLIAKHNARSAHEEFETIITEHIKIFEAANGEITVDDLETLKPKLLKNLNNV